MEGLLFLADAIKVAHGAYINLPLGNSRRGIALLPQGILPNDLEFLARLEDVRGAVVVQEIQVPTPANRGGTVAPAEVLHPVTLPGFGIQAAGYAWVRDQEKVFVMGNRRGDVRGSPRMAPENMGPGNVALAVGPDPQDVVIGIAAGDKKDPFEINHGGHKL